MMSSTAFLKNSFPYRPPSSYSISNSGLPKTNKFCPLSNGKIPTVKTNKLATISIICLLCSGSPFYIAGFIAGIIIGAVNRVPSRWSLTDMLKKAHEVAHPLSTNGYPSTTIPFKTWVVRVVAARLHTNPCSVLWSVIHFVRRDGVSLQTPTAFCLPTFEITPPNCADVSTITSANPVVATSLFDVVLLDNCKSAECLAGKIHRFWHKKISWLRSLVKESKRKAKYQWLSFVGSYPIRLTITTAICGGSK